MQLKMYFYQKKKYICCVCTKFPTPSYYSSTAHPSWTRTRGPDAIPRIAVKLEINLCRGDFQRPCLTSLKVQLRGWGNFSAVPSCLAPVCILPREIP